jgi:hypothetical protein
MTGVDRFSTAPLVDVATALSSCSAPRLPVQNLHTVRLENIALRRQLALPRRSAPKRLRLTSADRIFWVWLRHVWADWKSDLMIVKPETVVPEAWHRKGFRPFCRWKIHGGRPDRPRVPKEARDLIRMMSRNNPRWGAPRIHGEMLKLGIE